MTAPVDEEEVVVELRLQPVVARPDGWRGRSGGLIAAGLVGFIVVAFALGTALDERRPASSAVAIAPEPSASAGPAASRRPNATPRPQIPALPAREIVGGDIPTERRLVYANGPQVLDLATGELTTPPHPYEDVLLMRGDGEVVCVCMTREQTPGDTTSSTVFLRFERFDASGATIAERDVLTVEGIVDVPEMSLGFTMTATLSADDRYLYVLTASRRPPTWVIELHQVDSGSGELVGSTVLDELAIDDDKPEQSPTASAEDARPEGLPPDGLHVWANALAWSPDGSAMAATIAYSIIRGETWTSGFRELLVPIVDGHPGVPVTLGTDTELNTNGWCAGPAEFIDNDLMVQVCASPDEPGGNDAFWIRRLATSGAPSDAVPLRATRGEAHYQLVIAVDRPRRAVVSWDPVLHRLARVSIDDGTLVEQEVAASMLPEPAPGFDRGYFGADPGLVLSPDGKRLFALGFALGPSDSGTPTGIWVFDAESLNLLDRWPPRAMLTSLAVSDDGRFLYAAGANGFDVAGNQADWASSVTVYDAQTGEIEVVYGQVSGDSWVSFRPLP